MRTAAIIEYGKQSHTWLMHGTYRQSGSQVFSLPCRLAGNARSTASHQSVLGGVGSRKVKFFNVDHPLPESTIQNRTSPIAWVKSRCQGQANRTLSSDTTSIAVLHLGPQTRSTLGSQHHDNGPWSHTQKCHATNRGWIDLIEITASNTTPRSLS